MVGTILIVDDAAENITILATTLEEHYEVLVALSGEKALEMVATVRIDLILLDVEMPGLNGHEVCRKLKADPLSRDIPVIFLTGRSLVEDETKGLELGAVDYITKPFTPSLVYQRVKTHLELKSRQEAMISFLQIASHDLKTPLTVIKFCADLLEDPEQAGPISEAAKRAESLIESYLEVSRPGSEPLFLHFEKINLAQIVSEEIEFLRRSVPYDKLAIHNHIDDLEVRADRQKLRQILSNLISNAVKYSPRDAEVSIRAIKLDGEIRVSIRDQGVGLDRQEVEQLFRQFARMGYTDLVPGTGLGLWLTRALVRAHGGRIWVKSKPGAGSEFIFVLPQDFPEMI